MGHDYVVQTDDLDRWVPERDGSYTTPTHTAVSVLVTNTAVIAANPNRRCLLLINDSANIIYLMLGGTAVANQGIRLNAAGGNYEMSPRLGNLYRGAINAIALTGTSVLLVTDGV